MSGYFEFENQSFSEPYHVRLNNNSFFLLVCPRIKNTHEINHMFDAFREDLHQQLRIFRDYVEKKQNQRAIEYILGEIQLIQLKKWILEQNFQYSQSTPIQSSRAHSHKYIGTIIGTSPIGLDIEDIGIHSNAFDNAYFSNQEFELAKRLIPPSYGGIEGIESILLWTLKEATFKIQRLEKIGQIKQIQIENYNNSLTGIDSKSKNKYNLHFSILHNSILAIATD